MPCARGGRIARIARSLRARHSVGAACEKDIFSAQSQSGQYRYHGPRRGGKLEDVAVKGKLWAAASSIAWVREHGGAGSVILPLQNGDGVNLDRYHVLAI